MRTVLTLALALAATTPALAARGTRVAPPAPLPTTWSNPGASGEAPVSPWWEELGDPALDAIIEEALAVNFDLQGALAQIRQADATAQASLAALLPQLSLDYSISGQPAAVAQARFSFVPIEAFPDLAYSASAKFNARWNIDVFGAGIVGSQAAYADKLATIEDRAELSLAVAQQVATTWLDIALAAEQEALLTQQVESNRTLLELAELRFERAEATAVDVLQQRQQIAQLESQLPLVRASRTIGAQRLAVLLGRTPDDPPANLPTRLPAPMAVPGTGDPTDLERSRPDLRAADKRLTAAWRRRMQAERGFLPTFNLSFNAGWDYSNTQQIDFGLDGTEVGFGSVGGWGIGGGFSLPIFNGGLSIAQLRQARAAEQALAAQLSAARLAAAAEVEGALTQAQAQRERLSVIEAQATSAGQAFEASREQYASGLGPYLTVLTALVSKQAADLTYLQAWRDTLSADIQLRDALGGAWTHDLASGGTR